MPTGDGQDAEAQSGDRQEGQMEQRGKWIPASAPLSEAYWQALLREGERGPAAPTVDPEDLWDQRVPNEDEASETLTETVDAENLWQQARSAMDEGELLELPVVGSNRGGLLVGWNGLRGFVPASHLLEQVDTEDHRIGTGSGPICPIGAGDTGCR